MAAEDEGRTEEPSEYRLEKARKEEGRVAKSQEIGSSLILLFIAALLVFLGKWILGQCVDIYKFYFSRCTQGQVNDPNLATPFFITFAKIILPIGAVAIITGVLANILQNKGFIFTTKPLTPNFSKIAPKFGEYFKKTIFSSRGLFNIAKSIGKVVVIYAISFILIRKDMFELIQTISNGQILESMGKIGKMCITLLLIVAIVFVLISIPDYFVQRKEFMDSMKMTKQEVKQEMKELEGDPEKKARLDQMQRQILTQNIRKAVAEADVVVTNPTHYAVALQYDYDKADIPPKVTAKGEDSLALSIKALAKENDVPIVENRIVARGLYTETKVGDIIPSAYIETIALIYTHLEKFKNKFKRN